MRDRVRPYETVYTTAHEVHSTSELNRVNIVYKSYGIVWNCSQVLHPTPGLTLECHTITVRFTRVYTRFYTIAIRPIRFHTIAIRPIRFQYELYMVKYDQTRSLRLYKARVWSYSTRTQQKTQLPAATLKQQSTCYIMPPKKKKVPKRIPSENTKRATKAEYHIDQTWPFFGAILLSKLASFFFSFCWRVLVSPHAFWPK